MVLINLTANPGLPGLNVEEFPYAATFLNKGIESTYAIRSRSHLERRFNELDKSVTCPDEAEIQVMISNFPEVFSISS